MRGAKAMRSAIRRFKLSIEAVPKLQFWGDKLRLSSNLRFRACSIANKVCALTEFWNRHNYFPFSRKSRASIISIAINGRHLWPPFMAAIYGRHLWRNLRTIITRPQINGFNMSTDYAWYLLFFI
jgi:hypothetical protein